MNSTAADHDLAPR